jgi:hypothetical protein
MSNQVVYLVNCDAGLSEMCYYASQNQSLNGQAPDQTYQVTQPGFDIIWEGNAVSGKFNISGLNFTFTSNVNADAQPMAAGTAVGTGTMGPIFAVPPPGSPPGEVAYNGYIIYRDNNRVLYNNATLGNSTSLYVCVPVSLGLSKSHFRDHN